MIRTDGVTEAANLNHGRGKVVALQKERMLV